MSLPLFSTAEQSGPFDVFPQPVWFSDTAGSCLYANPAWTAYTGIDRTAALGGGALAAIHPDDREQFRAALVHRWTEHEPTEAEYRLLTAEGTHHWVCARSQAVLTPSGELDHWVSTCHDIHALKQAQHLQARRTEMTGRLLSLTRALAQTTDVNAALQMVLHEGHALLRAHGVLVFLLNDARTELLLTGVHGYRSDSVLAWRTVPMTTDLPVTEAVRSGEAIWLTERLTETYPGLRPLVEEYRIRAIACLPLVRGYEALGVVVLDFSEPQSFDAELRTLLLSAAVEISQALARTGPHALQRTAEHFHGRLDALISQLSGSLTRAEVHHAVLRAGAEATGAHGGFVTSPGADGTTSLDAQHGYREKFENLWLASLPEADLPVQTGQRVGAPLFLATRAELLSRFPSVEQTLALSTQALAVVPLRLDGQEIGTLTFSYSAPRLFDPLERQFLESLATYLARGLQQARVFEAEQRARQQAEQAVRQQQLSQQSLRSLLDSLPNLVWILTPEGEVQEFNEQWRRFSGLPRQMSGLDWLEAIHPDDRAQVRQERQRGLAGRHEYTQEMRMRRVDGLYRWHTARVVPVWVGDQLMQWVGSATDIEDQKRTEELLERRVQERTRRWQGLNVELQAITTTLASSLEEPLRRIIGVVRLIGRQQGRPTQETGERTVRLLHLLEQEVERVMGATQEIRQFADLENRELRLTRVPLDLLVIQVRSDLEPLTRTRKVRWQVGALPAVSADALLLRRVFAEIFLTLLRRTSGETEPTIALSGRLTGQDVQVQLETSSRFTTEEISLLFTPWGTEDEGGTAGLANVRRTMLRHGGQISATQTETGTALLLTFPCWPDSSDTASNS